MIECVSKNNVCISSVLVISYLVITLYCVLMRSVIPWISSISNAKKFSMTYMTGTTLSNRGILIYAPPESLTSGFHGRAYDIWLVGCTVAEMMTGSHVWIYRNTRDLQSQVMNEYPMIRVNVSEMANDLLHKCLIKDPLRRWTSEQLLQHPFIQQAICTQNSEKDSKGQSFWLHSCNT